MLGDGTNIMAIKEIDVSTYSNDINDALRYAQDLSTMDGIVGLHARRLARALRLKITPPKNPLDKWESQRKVSLGERAGAIARCYGGDTYKEVAKDFGVCVTTVREWCVKEYGPHWKNDGHRKPYKRKNKC